MPELYTESVATPYQLTINDREILADPQDKGEPGDLVVVWLKKRGPRLARRLARCSPFNSFYFRTPETGRVVEVPSNRVMAIHKMLEVTALV